MAVLGRYPGLSASEVAQRTAMDKVAVSRALARLVEAGRVNRGTHEGDKRRSVLSLSEAGWEVHDVVAPMARAREREVLAKLDADEQAWLSRILDKLLGPPVPQPRARRRSGMGWLIALIILAVLSLLVLAATLVWTFLLS